MQKTVLCGKSEEDLKMIARHFVEVCRSLKVNGDKSMVMVLGGEEELECAVRVNGCDRSKCQSSNVWCVFWTNQLQMVLSGKKVLGAIRSLGSAP